MYMRRNGRDIEADNRQRPWFTEVTQGKRAGEVTAQIQYKDRWPWGTIKGNETDEFIYVGLD